MSHCALYGQCCHLCTRPHAAAHRAEFQQLFPLSELSFSTKVSSSIYRYLPSPFVKSKAKQNHSKKIVSQVSAHLLRGYCGPPVAQAVVSPQSWPFLPLQQRLSDTPDSSMKCFFYLAIGLCSFPSLLSASFADFSLAPWFLAWQHLGPHLRPHLCASWHLIHPVGLHDPSDLVIPKSLYPRLYLPV